MGITKAVNKSYEKREVQIPPPPSLRLVLRDLAYLIQRVQSEGGFWKKGEELTTFQEVCLRQEVHLNNQQILTIIAVLSTIRAFYLQFN